MAKRTWSGVTDGDVTKAGNWDTIPSAADTAEIPVVATNYPSTGIYPASGAVTVDAGASILGGTWGVVALNSGTISGGAFGAVTSNAGTISGGTFTTITNAAAGIISGGTFTTCTNNGTITGTAAAPTFSGAVTNNLTISGGAFAALVTNAATGTISGVAALTTLTNTGTISGGTVSGAVTNSITTGVISGGTFAAAVTNNNLISGGAFGAAATVNNALAGSVISGGTFLATVTNTNAVSTISGGSFTTCTNNGIISAGTFTGAVNNAVATSSITGGTFTGVVTNTNGASSISGGTLAAVINNGIITTGATVLGAVTNNLTISGGTFGALDSVALVTNAGAGTISAGSFYGLVANAGAISGGTFYHNVTGVGTHTGGTFLEGYGSAVTVNAAGKYVGPGHIHLGTHIRGRAKYLTPRRKEMLFQQVAQRALSAGYKAGNVSKADLVVCTKALREGVMPRLYEIINGLTTTLAHRDMVDVSQTAEALSIGYEGEVSGLHGPIGYYNWHTQYQMLVDNVAVLVTNIKAAVVTATT